MKKNISKYILEFLVIVLGISVSFAWDARTQANYKTDLKNRSLGRIVGNLEADISDLKFNLDIHQNAVNAINRLYFHQKEVQKNDPDSIAYYLTASRSMTTMFNDNQEEYFALRNSGLIELIDNEEIISMLQNKHAVHDYFKNIESTIINVNSYPEIRAFVFKNSIGIVEGMKMWDLIDIVDLPDKLVLPPELLSIIKEKSGWHELYAERIIAQLEKDILLKELILIEID